MKYVTVSHATLHDLYRALDAALGSGDVVESVATFDDEDEFRELAPVRWALTTIAALRSPTPSCDDPRARVLSMVADELDRAERRRRGLDELARRLATLEMDPAGWHTLEPFVDDLPF